MAEKPNIQKKTDPLSINIVKTMSWYFVDQFLDLHKHDVMKYSVLVTYNKIQRWQKRSSMASACLSR